MLRPNELIANNITIYIFNSKVALYVFSLQVYCLHIKQAAQHNNNLGVGIKVMC